jgi:hypothetical protein
MSRSHDNSHKVIVFEFKPIVFWQKRSDPNTPTQGRVGQKGFGKLEGIVEE